MTAPRLTASMRAVLTAPLFVTTLRGAADKLEQMGYLTVTEWGRTSGPNKRDFVRYTLTGAGESLRTELKGK